MEPLYVGVWTHAQLGSAGIGGGGDETLCGIGQVRQPDGFEALTPELCWIPRYYKKKT